MTSVNDLLGSAAKPLATTRNTFLDALFYDVKALSAADLKKLSEIPDLEGAVIVVSPKNADKEIRRYESATQMLHAERDTIAGVAVAGAGSSIVGTAALARNVADAYGFDVAGIVSGYGASDLLAEAMGGRFFYGYFEKFRHHIKILIEKAAQALPVASADNRNDSLVDDFDYRDHAIPRELDSGTLLDILAAHPENLKILIGHSKGALLIDYVLDEFVRRMGSGHSYYDDLQVVTVSAVVGIPKEFTKTSQIIGKLDWFGGMNSLPDLLWDKDPKTQPKYIENAWHHLNRDLPYKLSLVEALGTHVPLG